MKRSMSSCVASGKEGRPCDMTLLYSVELLMRVERAFMAKYSAVHELSLEDFRGIVQRELLVVLKHEVFEKRPHQCVCALNDPIRASLAHALHIEVVLVGVQSALHPFKFDVVHSYQPAVASQAEVACRMIIDFATDKDFLYAATIPFNLSLQ